MRRSLREVRLRAFSLWVVSPWIFAEEDIDEY
jgi:hypothetical protein